MKNSMFAPGELNKITQESADTINKSFEDKIKSLTTVSDDVIEAIYQNITVAGSNINYNSMVNFNKYNQMVWNDMIADMVKISETYPETIFLVKVYESVNGLNSTFYFKNGKMQYNPVIKQGNQFDSKFCENRIVEV